MRRDGVDENNVQMSDVLCDFCEQEWTDDRPMVEGHRGSCACGSCVRIAYTDVILGETNSAPSGYQCPMCRETD